MPANAKLFSRISSLEKAALFHSMAAFSIYAKIDFMQKN
ncbi:hypothetical protein ACADC178_0362 [Lactobacillus delbrueckii subsp. lactis]|nr:hypothetical protein G134_188 [Lactobacillus delbrueckii subsp. lactis CRL581]SUY97057.1 hypothetical protein ACADC178_0362 [Lactobacillus delbrueckii subsp. lactis]